MWTAPQTANTTKHPPEPTCISMRCSHSQATPLRVWYTKSGTFDGKRRRSVRRRSSFWYIICDLAVYRIILWKNLVYRPYFSRILEILCDIAVFLLYFVSIRKLVTKSSIFNVLTSVYFKFSIYSLHWKWYYRYTTEIFAYNMCSFQYIS